MIYDLEVTATAKENYSDIALNIYEQSKSVDVAIKFVPSGAGISIPL